MKPGCEGLQLLPLSANPVKMLVFRGSIWYYKKTCMEAFWNTVKEFEKWLKRRGNLPLRFDREELEA